MVGDGSQGASTSVERLRAWIIGALDALGSPLLLVALAVGRAYRRLGTGNTPIARRLYDLVGVYPIIDHYHEPLIRPKRNLRRSLRQPRLLPGIDLRIPEQLDLLAQLQNYGDELKEIPYASTPGTDPYYSNPAFAAGDAEILYKIIRHVRPERVIEIGAGHSSRFIQRALQRNQVEDTRHICIEPYENPWLEELDAQVIRSRLETTDPEIFEELTTNDLLFIDSSHIIRPQGDVLFEYLTVVPRLRSGVIVHIHDIFTPRDYPPDLMIRRRDLYNEQYLVEALLTGNSNLQVMLALNHLYHDHRAALEATCPVLASHPEEREPASFWLRVR